MGGVTEQQAEVGSSSTTSTEASSSGSRSGGVRSSPLTREQRMKSVVEDQGEYSSTCGYCKAPSRSSIAQGLWAYRLTVHDYQDLLDRGWRRSGMFLYKPCMKSTCCPPYTIRLKAESFIATKDQMRVLRRMQRYLDGKLDGPQTVGELHKEKDDTFERGKGLPSDNHLASFSDRSASRSESLPSNVHQVFTRDVSETAIAEEEELLGRLKAALEIAIRNCVGSGFLPSLLEPPTIVVKPVSQKVKGKLENLEGEVDYTSSVAFALAALLKREGKFETLGDGKLKDQNAVIPEASPQGIAEMLVGKLLDSCEMSGFTVKACKGHLNFILPEINKSSLTVLQAKREKKLIVGTKKQLPTSGQSTSESLASVGQLEIRMKRSSFDAEEFALYKKYQVRVHNDRPEDVKEGSYRRFLVDSPLIFVPPLNDGTTPSCGFGSFHQQYSLNGRLVAVGVLDILPHCLSSKYLFWDPDFAFLALGKYSALQEIKWVQEAQKVCSSLRYYYLGFYIHSCPKMRYKAGYYPSELLCPEQFRWVAYELAVPYLDAQSYLCLTDIANNPVVSIGSSSPGIKRNQEAGSTSGLDNENGQTDMEIEADFSPVDAQEELDTALKVFVEKDVQPVNVSSGTLSDIQLCLNGACLSFKQLQELALVPRWHLDTLVHHLRRYLQGVGPSLAARMAYTLS